MSQERKTSHYIGKISNIQDSIILCDEMYSNPFVGEIVYFNNNTSYKGLINLKNIKILLLDCDQKNWDSIFGSRETIKIKVGFNVLGHTITQFGNLLKTNVNNSDELLSTLKSPSIIYRKKVPLLTGINSVDCLFFIGLGIIGVYKKHFNLNSKIKTISYKKKHYLCKDTKKYYSNNNNNICNNNYNNKVFHTIKKKSYSIYLIDSKEWNFTYGYLGLEINADLTVSFNKDEDDSKIFDYLNNYAFNFKLNWVKGIGDAEIDVNLFTYRKKNNINEGLLYTFFYDGIDYSKHTNKPFNEYIYIFYKKKIDSIEYQIYCIYFLHDNYSFDGPSEVMSSSVYIYKNLKTDSYDEKINRIIFDKLYEKAESGLAEGKSDPFFRKHLLNAISELVACKMEKVNSKFLKNHKSKINSLFSNKKQYYCKKMNVLKKINNQIKAKILKSFNLLKLFLGYSSKIHLIHFNVDCVPKSYNNINDVNWKEFFFNEWLIDSAWPDSTIIPLKDNKHVYFSYDSDDCFEDWFFIIDLQLKVIDFKKQKHTLYCIYYLDQLSIVPIEPDENDNYHLILKCDIYFGEDKFQNNPTREDYFELKNDFVKQHRLSLTLENKLLYSIDEIKKIQTQIKTFRKKKQLLIYNKQKRDYTTLKGLKISSQIYTKKANKDLIKEIKNNVNDDTVYNGIIIPNQMITKVSTLLNHNSIFFSLNTGKKESNFLFSTTSTENADRLSKINNEVFQILKNENISLFDSSSYNYKVVHVFSGTIWDVEFLEHLGFKINTVPYMNLSKEAFYSQYHKVKDYLLFKPTDIDLSTEDIEIYYEEPVSLFEKSLKQNNSSEIETGGTGTLDTDTGTYSKTD